MCLLGSTNKKTIIYELELVAAVFAMEFLRASITGGLQIWFGDNDAVRHALIKGTGMGHGASVLMERHLANEFLGNWLTWYARVPTESNLSDYPSRQVPHALLGAAHDHTSAALQSWQNFLNETLGPKRFYGGGSDA